MKKTGIIISFTTGIIIAFILIIPGLYLKGIPYLISNGSFINFVSQTLAKSIDAQIIIEEPKLITQLNTDVNFKIKTFKLINQNNSIADIENFEIDFSYKNIFHKKIDVKKLGADNIFINLSEITKLSAKFSKNENKKASNWTINLFNAVLYIKQIDLIYAENQTKYYISGKNIEITNTRNPKKVKFNLTCAISNNNKKLLFNFNDEDKIFFSDRKLYAKNAQLHINKSNIIINALMRENADFEINLHSKKFLFEDINDLLASNIFIPNGDTLLNMFDDINGNFDFNINLNNKEFNGNIDFNNLFLKIKMLNNIPLTLTSGKIKITKNNISLNNFEGYYGKSKNNKILSIKGNIKDYQKTFDAKIESYVVATKEFTTDYLTPTINYPIELVGHSVAKIKLNMLGNKIDTAIIFRLKKGFDILVDKTSLTPVNYERAFRADITLNGDNIEIKDINYYIADHFKQNVVVKPLVQVYGNFNAKDMAVKNLGFEIVKPLPSEFLNVLLRARVFRKGKISGKLEYIATGKIPYMQGNLSFDDVRVPSQRLLIKSGRLTTSNDYIDLNVSGKYRKTAYKLDGKILNKIILPIKVTDIGLDIAELNIGQVMQSMANQTAKEKTAKEEIIKTLTTTDANIADTENNTTVLQFPKGLFEIQKGTLNIHKGSYKEIAFDNAKGEMSLSSNGILNFKTNFFNIADGKTTSKVFCDLHNGKYVILLGVKEVNADLISTAILSLPREVSGKASGFIKLETDNSLKLNGMMKFHIKNGTIAKVGLIEYALNFIALFRNPLAMISPATVFDIMNIPEGSFKKISGSLELKDNVIQKIYITSQAPQLSSYIAGKYDIEKSDASIRIYTKFSNKNKGFTGFLRKFSLSALANSVPLNTKNDTNYYESELKQIPPIEANEKDSQVFLTKVEGDVAQNNFLSSLKRIK